MCFISDVYKTQFFYRLNVFKASIVKHLIYVGSGLVIYLNCVGYWNTIVGKSFHVYLQTNLLENKSLDCCKLRAWTRSQSCKWSPVLPGKLMCLRGRVCVNGYLWPPSRHMIKLSHLTPHKLGAGLMCTCHERPAFVRDLRTANPVDRRSSEPHWRRTKPRRKTSSGGRCHWKTVRSRQMRQTDINRGRADGTTTPAPWAERKQKQPPPHITHTHTHVSYQNKWPHILMTASLAASKQMLHSKVARSGSRSPSPLPPSPPSPSRPLLLSPAENPALLAGPPSLEDRGSAAAIILLLHESGR